MKKRLKPLIRIAIFIVTVIVIYLAIVIIYGSVTEYKPEAGSSESLEIKNQGKDPKTMDSIVHLMIWNLGYGGLGKEADFFFDGGKTVRADRTIWDKDFKGQLSTITQAADSIDFILVQEIDQHSKRSYDVNQYDSVTRLIPDFASVFAVNYDVNFVPKPYFRPYGHVYSGVATFSRFQPAESKRFQYPGHFGWPTKIFFLDRCFLAQRYPLANGKELVIFNTHNSAYDESGEIKKQEMEFLKNHLLDEYAKGNYVIAGGDWNQCPPGFDIHKFQVTETNDFIPPAIDFDLMPENWLWCYDPTQPTNRNVDNPLNDSTFKTIIDYYIVSPNIKLLKINTINNGFEYSDHQPVEMSVQLEK